MSVREEFWVSPWLVSHAENVVRGAYDDCGHFKDCSMPSSLHMSQNDSVKCQKMSQKMMMNIIIIKNYYYK